MYTAPEAVAGGVAAASDWWSLGIVLLVGPFIWMVLGSFKTTGELRSVPPTWWPENPTLANYQDLFDRQNFLRFFINSSVVAFFVTAGKSVPFAHFAISDLMIAPSSPG